MDSIKNSLKGPRKIFSTLPIDSFTSYIDDYRNYRGYLDNTTTLFEQMGIEKPKKNEYSNDECIIINIYIYIQLLEE